jgi:GTP-binding protein
VGKSTLFNRICRKRSAIVDFEEGVTRDRKYESVDWNDRQFLIVDTGGIIPDSDYSIDKAIILQAQIAIEQADVVIFLCEVKTDITHYDSEIAKILSTFREKLMLVVNKVDNEKDELDLYRYLQLGLGEPIGIAAASGRNTGNFMDALTNLLPKVDTTDDTSDEAHLLDKIKVAIVGKPNVGKSSLINKLVGENTVIVTDVPGTTRDSIDLELIYQNHKIVFIDTAGLRRKAKIKYGVEYFSSMRTIDSITRADIIVLVLDSYESISDQDQKIAAFAQRHFKNIIILLNKWDLIPDKGNKTFDEYIKKIRYEFPFLDYAPILTISALTGQRVNKLSELILKVWTESITRISTGELNRFFEKVIQKNPPYHKTGKHIKIYYVTQENVNPPTFIFFTNEPKSIPVNYKRFLRNKIREEFRFTGATIKLIFKGKNNDILIEY